MPQVAESPTGAPAAAASEPTTKMSVRDGAVERRDQGNGSGPETGTAAPASSPEESGSTTSTGRHRAVDAARLGQPDSAHDEPRPDAWVDPSNFQATQQVTGQPGADNGWGRPDQQGAVPPVPAANNFAAQQNQTPGQPLPYAPNQGQQGGFAPTQGQPVPYPPATGQDPNFAPPQGQPAQVPQQGYAQQGQPGSPAPAQMPPNAYGQQPGYGTPPPPQQYGNPAAPRGPVPSLDDVPMRRMKKAPGSGWRKAVHHMSGGAINPGMSAEERRLQELVARIRQPVRGDYRIAVLSLKGGVGKTTTTMGLGSIFSSIRGDRVIAVDANPDFGTLSQRVPLQTRSTVRDLLLDEHIRSYSDVRRHTSQSTSRLEVLASERDPAASESFSEEEYRAVARILQRYYNIILTDCGTGLMHSAMAGVLDLAHSLVLISSSAIDGARSAAATLDWLSLHGHDHLVRNAVVVINLPREGSPNVGIQQLREYFLARCRAVHIIPFDEHLAEGAEIDLTRLHKTTKRAMVELAAAVADDFAVEHHRYR